MFIGVMGKARSGKDTFAEMLAEELFLLTKKKFILMAYATELKLRVQKDFDLSYEQLWGDQKEVEDKRYPKPNSSGFWTPREILQAYGEFYRSIKYNFWVDHLFKIISDKNFKNVIVTDVRHPNEADPVVRQGGYLIKVVSNRDGKEAIRGANHISETAMDSYDNINYIVGNNAGLLELKDMSKDIAKAIIDSELTKKRR